MQGNFLYRPICELCESGRKEVLYSEGFTDPVVWDFLRAVYKDRINKNDLEGGKYEIVRCLDCGFIWQSYILNNELMATLYDYWISPEESLQRAKQAGFSTFAGYAREASAIYSLVSKQKIDKQKPILPSHIKVLDFGCGWGYWCLMAKAFGYDVYGFDIAQTRLVFARRNGLKIISNLEELRLWQFDFINVESVFEHMANPLKTLKILVRCLKDNGVIRISIPNGKKFERAIKKPGWGPGKDQVSPLEHISCFNHQTLVRFAQSAGLEMTKQPFLLSFRSGFRDYLRGILGKYYKQLFGRALYFKKHTSGV